MYNKMNFKKIALCLFAVVLFCFAAAAILFYQIDVKGMNLLNGEHAKDVDGTQNSDYIIDAEEAFDVGEVNKVILEAFSSDINIIPTNDNVIKVHVYGNAVVQNEKEKPQPEIKLNNGVVYAKDNNNTSQKHKVQLFAFDFLNTHNEIVMDVYIPSDFAKELKVDSFSGIINIGDFALGDLSVKTFSGDVEAGNLSSDNKTVFESSSGRIKVKKIIANDIKVNSFSGDINIESIDSESAYFDSSSGRGTLGDINSKTFRFATFSGDIKINTLTSEDSDISSSSGIISVKGGNTGKIRFKTFSGDINGENIGSKDTDIDTSSGRVFVSGLEGKLTVQSFSGNVEAGFVRNPGDVFIKTSSGEIGLDFPSDAAFKLDAHTISGNVKCDFPIQISGSADDNTMAGIVGPGDGNIKIETFSGGIEIRMN